MQNGEDCENTECVVVLMFFFFSSRRRHTRLQGDWSSDVCSSDLGGPLPLCSTHRPDSCHRWRWPPARREPSSRPPGDRKSTRLNSSHLVISYAVFCLKKKSLQPAGHRSEEHTSQLQS